MEATKKPVPMHVQEIAEAYQRLVVPVAPRLEMIVERRGISRLIAGKRTLRKV